MNSVKTLEQRISRKLKKYPESFFSFLAFKMTGANSSELVEALMGFQENEENLFFGIEYLSLFVKKGVKVSEEELENYSLILDLRTDDTFGGFYFREKYFDTMFNFCLTYNKEFIASLGFDVGFRKMCIHQIQGKKGKEKELKPFKWTFALLDYAVSWAESFGLSEVMVVSSKNLGWTRKGHLDEIQGKLLYDVTAKRSGFEKDSFGNYRLKIG